MHTTLNEIRFHSPCEESWIKLLQFLNKTKADDEPLKFRTIYEALNADDLLWCSRTLDKKSRVYLGAKFAETSLQYSDDGDVHNCIAICFEYAKGKATEDELTTALFAVRYCNRSAAANGAASANTWTAARDAASAARDAARTVSSVKDARAIMAASLEKFATIMLEYTKQDNQ